MGDGERRERRTDTFPVQQEGSEKILLQHTRYVNTENVVPGMDIEVGGKCPGYKDLWFHCKGYRFGRAMLGVGGRSELHMRSWCSLGIGYSYDTVRKHMGHVELQIRFPSKESTDVLDQKMTQLLVRDVDAVTKEK